MRLLVDENIRQEVIDWLKAAGHDVLMAPSGTDDKRIAKLAQKTKRTIITHDKHFADILMYPPHEYSGIIRIRVHPPSAAAIITALSHLFKNVSAEDMDKRLIVLRKENIRIR